MALLCIFVSCSTTHFRQGEIFDTVNISKYRIANYDIGEEVSGTIGEPFAKINIGWSHDAYEVVESFKPLKLYGSIDVSNFVDGDKLKVYSKYKSNGKEGLLLEHVSFNYSGIPHYLSITKDGYIDEGWVHKDGTAIDTTQQWNKTKPIFTKSVTGFPIKDDVKKFELIYRGKIGSIVRIRYREYEGNKPIPVFEDSYEYDMNESSNFAVKSFKGEIVKASSTEIVVIIKNDPFGN